MNSAVKLSMVSVRRKELCEARSSSDTVIGVLEALQRIFLQKHAVTNKIKYDPAVSPSLFEL